MAIHHFNIHGLALEVSASHPFFNDFFLDELQSFRVKESARATKPLRFNLSVFNGRTSQPEMASMNFRRSGSSISQYGKSLIIVNSYHKKRQMDVRVSDQTMDIFPDPAYHYCLTQPLSLWFKKMGLFFLHAGCVSLHNQSVLIIGHSQAGKSSLTLSAVKHGFDFLSDEQPLLSFQKNSVLSHSFPRRIRLNKPVASIFPELKSLVAKSSQHRLVFPIENIWPQSICPAACPPRLLIFPRFIKQGKFKISPLDPVKTLARLLQDDHFVWYKNKPWDKISNRHLILFQQLIDQARSFELNYSHQDILRIPSLLKKLLRH